MKMRTAILSAMAWCGLLAGASAFAQTIPTGVTYVCGGERLYVENCNIRDLSDTSTCMVAHPDRPQHNGFMAYTTETRGALKKLLPTCTQPSAKDIAAEAAFKKKQQEIYDANVQKANPQVNATQPNAGAMNTPQQRAPMTPDQRALNRCITSGRLPASCTGNSLLGAFGQMLSQVLPGADKQAAVAGPTMAGVFQGAGNWRLDFIDGGVLVNCSFLSPNQQSYKIDFRSGGPVIVIDTTPKPLVLTLRADGTITGPGPLQINGVVASGTAGGQSTPGHTETNVVTTYQPMTEADASIHAGDPNVTHVEGGYQMATTTTQSTYVPGTSTPVYSTFSPRTATCPALNLSSKGSGVGIQTMQTDLLKTMFGGDKGAPTPPGIRMSGSYAASTGFSVQFFPESAILGCGLDAARAYPYTVVPEGGRAVVKIEAPDHPLTLAFRPDGSLDPGGSGAYQVHGRAISGQNDNDDFTFTPNEQSCNLGILTASQTIPSGGGQSSATSQLATGTTGGLSSNAAGGGNATLSVTSGFPPGAANPLAGHPYVLLRSSFTNVVASGGVPVPPGTSPYKVMSSACVNRNADCQKIMEAVKANAVGGVRADANGSGTFSGLAAGTYYLMISTRYNNQGLAWGQAVQVRPGANSVTLDLRNATPLN